MHESGNGNAGARRMASRSRLRTGASPVNAFISAVITLLVIIFVILLVTGIHPPNF
jgi:hypothetical protein